MHLKLSSSRFGELPLSSGIPEEYSTLKIAGAESVFAEWAKNHLLLQLRQSDAFTIYHAHLAGGQADHLNTSYLRNVVVLHLCLQGSIRYQLQGLPPITLHERAYNIYYAPVWLAKFTIPEKSSNSVFICMSTDVLYKHSFRFDKAKELLLKIRDNEVVKLSRSNLIADYNLLMMVCNALAGHDAGDWLQEAADYAIESAFVGKKVQKAKLDNHIIEKLYQIKQIITADLKASISLEELAQITGLTQYQLRTWFPQIYGMSISEYRIESKICKAVEMLDKSEKVAVIANHVGYSESQLRRIFNDYFGCPMQAYARGLRKKV